MRVQLLCTLNLWPATPTRRVKTESECVKTDRVKTELCETVLLVHEHSDEMDYIAVMEEGKEPVEVELEEDLTIALSTLSNEFGTGISGLSYRNPKTGLRRVLRISGDGTRVNPPREGWSSELTYVVSRVKSEEIGVPVEKVTPGENQLSVKKEVKDTETKATAGFSAAGKKRSITKSELLKMQGKSAVARNAVHSWNTLNTTIRRLVQATQWEGSGGMTKCEGTTKEQALHNREKREALVRDERVMKCFCEYTLETETGEGVVLLDYNHAVDHVRHCLNSMKKFGSFATIKVEQEDYINASDANAKICKDPVLRPKALNRQFKGADAVSDQKAAKRRKLHSKDFDDLQTENDVTGREVKEHQLLSEEVEDENEENDYLQQRERRINENKEMLFSLGMPCLSDEDFTVVGRSWFPPELAARLTLGRVAKELQAFGVKRPQRCGLKDALVLLAKELLRTSRVTIKKMSNLTRGDIVCTSS